MNRECDVAIVGAGLFGSMMAAILARNNISVLLIDDKAHPRFTIGESTIPKTTAFLKCLAYRFDVPEILALTSPQLLNENVGSTSGVKKGFGFVHHAQDAVPVGWQMQVPTTESHFYRQDVDAYMFYAAVKRGAVPLMGCAIERLTRTEDCITFELNNGGRVRARFLMDASGSRSKLPAILGLQRERELKHRTSVAFTHMVDVKDFDDANAKAALRNQSELKFRWSESTLHHVFAGGWVWVIPFNNHPSSQNPLCSVGLNLQSNSRQATPSFGDIARQFPEIERQFSNAVPVRPWLTMSQVQYRVKSSVGARFCLSSHTSGFVDPLFSRGMANSAVLTYATAVNLLNALADNKFSADRFATLDEIQSKQLLQNENIVYGTYRSFRDPDLFHNWLRIWQIATSLDFARNENVLRSYEERGDPSCLDELLRTTNVGLFAQNPKFLDLLEFSLGLIEAHDRNEISFCQLIQETESLVNETERSVYPD